MTTRLSLIHLCWAGGLRISPQPMWAASCRITVCHKGPVTGLAEATGSGKLSIPASQSRAHSVGEAWIIQVVSLKLLSGGRSRKHSWRDRLRWAWKSWELCQRARAWSWSHSDYSLRLRNSSRVWWSNPAFSGCTKLYSQNFKNTSSISWSRSCVRLK